MTAGAGLAVPSPQVDGGTSATDLLCQLQADQPGVPVHRPRLLGTTALRAGLGAGVWSSPDELRGSWQLDRRFDPAADVRGDGTHERWCRGLECVAGWA